MVFSSFQDGLPVILGKFGPPPQNEQPLVIGWSNVMVSVFIVAASTSPARRAGAIATIFGGASWAATVTSSSENDTVARARIGDLRPDDSDGGRGDLRLRVTSGAARRTTLSVPTALRHVIGAALPALLAAAGPPQDPPLALRIATALDRARPALVRHLAH